MIKPIVLYDDTCSFCNFWLAKIRKWDKGNQIEKLGLATDVAREMMLNFNIDSSIDSIVFVHNEKVFYRSQAILMLLQSIDKWRFVQFVIRYMPLKLADAAYDFMARNRGLFGMEKKNCPLTP